MLKRGSIKALLLIITIGLLSGCELPRFTFTGADIPPEAKTVSVALFPNKAPLASPTLSFAFTEAMRDIMQNQTKLELVDEEGDLHYEGNITGYDIKPVAVTENETAAMNRLTITVKVTYNNTLQPDKSFDKTFSKFMDYDSSQSLSSIESELIADINDLLVQDIFNQSLGNW